MSHPASRAALCGALLVLMAGCSPPVVESNPPAPIAQPTTQTPGGGPLPVVLSAVEREGVLNGSVVLNADRVAQLDGILSRMAADETFSGSVLIAQDGEVLLNRGYGSADREQEISNTPQTRFLIGSVSKQFTAMAILILQSQGRLNVQDTICRYIEDGDPGEPGADEPVPVRAGLPGLDRGMAQGLATIGIEARSR